jgi:voltage-gated potassium channel
MWNNKKGYQDKSIVRLLPRKMQAELFSHINRPVIEKVPFLADAGADLIEDLMHDLEPRFCVPDEKVFKIGDEGDAMYFIYKGKIEILSESRELIATLNEGDFFGEKALLDDRKRTATARAAEFCEIYVLRKETFFTVCQHYPEFLAHVNEVKSKRN